MPTTTPRPIYCLRCPRLAVVIVEAGTPTTRTRRAACACARHIAQVRRWCARSGATRLIPVRQPGNPVPDAVQLTLFDLEVTP